MLDEIQFEESGALSFESIFDPCDTISGGAKCKFKGQLRKKKITGELIRTNVGGDVKERIPLEWREIAINPGDEGRFKKYSSYQAWRRDWYSCN